MANFKSVSDTPRTDAVCWMESAGEPHEVVEAHFARQLERECFALRFFLSAISNGIEDVLKEPNAAPQADHSGAVMGVKLSPVAPPAVAAPE